MSGTPLPPDLQARRPAVAAVLERWWTSPIEAYAKQLGRHRAGRVDDSLRAAFDAHGLDLPGVLATGHHVTPTNGPGFLAADLLGCLFCEPYAVAAFSGVAVCNTAWSGALSYGRLEPHALVAPGTSSWRRLERADRERVAAGSGERRLSFVPARERDALLYRLPLPEPLAALWPDLQPDLRLLLPTPGGTLPRWGIAACQVLQERVLRRTVRYVDLNEVVTTWLLDVLRTDHPLARALFDGPRPDSEHPWFYARYHGKKGEKVDPLRPEGGELVGRTRVPCTRDEVLARLEDGRLCPGLFVCFSALTAFSDIKCLGSFNQEAYLPGIARAWGVERPPHPGETLVAGRMPDQTHPLDLALSGSTAWEVVDPGEPMSRLWEPVLGRL